MSTKLDKDVRRQVIDAARVGGKIICAGCKREVIGKGFEIDHIRAEIDGGAVHDPDNLQVLCVRKDGLGCHAKKTKREAAARAARRKQLEKSPLGRALPAASALTGASLTGYATATLAGLELPAVDPTSIAYGTLLGLAGLVTVDQWRHWRGPAKGVMEDGSKAKPDVEQQTPEQRLTSVLREVITKNDKGTVRVSGLKMHDDGMPAEFTATYAGTEFPDREERRRAEVRDQLAIKYDGIRWLLAWDQTRDRLHVKRRPPMPRKINHPGLSKDRKWHVIPIAPDGRFDFLITPHVLIIGATGGGKTSLLRAMVVAVLASARDNDNIEAWLIDPKEIEFLGFEGWPGVTHLFADIDELWEFPLKLLAEMRERYRLLRAEKVPLESHRIIIVIIDEFRDLVRRLEDEWSNNPARGKKTGMKNPALNAISELLAKARRAGIHIVISTQRPEAAWFGGENRANVTGRAGVGPLDPDAARMIFNQTVGTDIPDDLKGRTSLQVEDKDVVEVQTYWVPDPADADRFYRNTAEDWGILRTLGMPEDKIPEAFRLAA
jgi:hypothetical protein